MKRTDTNPMRDDERSFRDDPRRPRYDDQRDHDRYEGHSESPEAIEADIRRNRTQMDKTLDELTRRLEPSAVISEVWSALRQHVPGTSDAAGAASSAAKYVGAGLASRVASHPLPSALIGAGLVWLITEEARKGGSHTSHHQSDFRSAARGAGHSFGHGIADAGRSAGHGIADVGRSAGHGIADAGRSAGHGITDAGRSVARSAGRGIADAADYVGHSAERSMHAVSDAARDMGDRAMHGISDTSSRTARAANAAAHNVADNTAQAYERYPLGFSVAALGAGILAGLALPNTRRENRWMGETARDFRRDAWDVGEGEVAHAIDAGSKRAAAAVDSMASRAEDAVRGDDDSRNPSHSSSGRHSHQDQDYQSTKPASSVTTGSATGSSSGAARPGSQQGSQQEIKPNI